MYTSYEFKCRNGKAVLQELMPISVKVYASESPMMGADGVLRMNLVPRRVCEDFPIADSRWILTLENYKTKELQIFKIKSRYCAWQEWARCVDYIKTGQTAHYRTCRG